MLPDDVERELISELNEKIELAQVDPNYQGEPLYRRFLVTSPRFERGDARVSAADRRRWFDVLKSCADRGFSVDEARDERSNVAYEILKRMSDGRRRR